MGWVEDWRLWEKIFSQSLIFNLHSIPFSRFFYILMFELVDNTKFLKYFKLFGNASLPKIIPFIDDVQGLPRYVAKQLIVWQTEQAR